MARGYGSFSIWYSNKTREKRKADITLNNMSGKEFYDSYNPIRHLVTNKKVLKRLAILDNVYGK